MTAEDLLNGLGGPALAFDGVRVVDCATLLAGPIAAGLLGDWGAEVVKVEAPGAGDPLREYPPIANGVSLLHKVTNRNKLSATFDLRVPEGQQLLRELAIDSDVLIVNFRPQTLARWGLDYEALREANPGLVMLHVTAYGRSGPYSARPGFARIAESFAGLAHITGFPDREPVLSGYPLVDALTGLYGAWSIAGALHRRARTGQGALLDLALYDGLLRLLEDLVVGVEPTGEQRERVGNTNPNVAPNALYRAADGEYVVIPASTNSTFRRLMRCIGREDLAHDARLATNPGRVAERPMLDQAIEEWLSRHGRHDAVRLLQEHDVPVGVVMSPRDILEDRHIEERGNLQRVHDDETGTDLTMQAPVPLGEGVIRFPGRPLGADTDEVLTRLGRGPLDIARLRQHHVI